MFKRLGIITALLLSLTSPVFARGRFFFYVQKGGSSVSTSSAQSLTKVQRSFPGATVKVCVTGTSCTASGGTLATLYSNSTGTPLANPFTAGTDGSGSFWTDTTVFDLVFYGKGITTQCGLSGQLPCITAFTWTNQSFNGAAATSTLFNVLDYGADNTGVTDAGAAIQAAAAAMSTAGTGTLYFPTGTYKLFSAAGGVIVQFSNKSNLRILLDGGVIFAIDPTNAATYSTAGYGAIFNFGACNGVTFEGILRVTGPNLSTLAFAGGTAKGVNAIQIVNCTNVYIPTAIIQGAQSAINGQNDAGFGYMNRNVHIGLLSATQCFYGVTASYGAANWQVDHLVTDTVYRSLFMYSGVYGLRVNLDVKDNYGNDVILLSQLGAGLEDLFINYRRDSRTTNSPGGGKNLYVGFGDETPALNRNWNFIVDVDYAGSGTTGAGVFRLIKQLSNGTADTTDRGHKLYGLHVSGTIKGTPSATTGAAVDFDQADKWGATLDEMRNLVFDNLTVTGYTGATGIDIDANAVRDTVSLQNVDVGTASAIRVRDYAASVVTQASAHAIIETLGVVCSNLDVLDGASGGYPIRTRLIDSATMTLPASWFSGVGISNRGIVTNPHTTPLPAAVPNKGAVFMNESGGVVAWRLDPNGTETIRGGGAGKYLELSSGTSVYLQCFTAGTWEIVYKNGTTAFEP